MQESFILEHQKVKRPVLGQNTSKAAQLAALSELNLSFYSYLTYCAAGCAPWSKTVKNLLFAAVAGCALRHGRHSNHLRTRFCSGAERLNPPPNRRRAEAEALTPSSPTTKL